MGLDVRKVITRAGSSGDDLRNALVVIPYRKHPLAAAHAVPRDLSRSVVLYPTAGLRLMKIFVFYTACMSLQLDDWQLSYSEQDFVAPKARVSSLHSPASPGMVEITYLRHSSLERFASLAAASTGRTQAPRKPSTHSAVCTCTDRPQGSDLSAFDWLCHMRLCCTGISDKFRWDFKLDKGELASAMLLTFLHVGLVHLTRRKTTMAANGPRFAWFYAP